MGLRKHLNEYLVRIDGRYVNREGGMLVDVSYNPQEWVMLSGEVVGVPFGVEDDGFRQMVGGVEVGRRIWFNYNVVFNYVELELEGSAVYRNLVEHEGEDYWKVDVSDVFLYDGADGVVRSYGSNVVIGKVEESGDGLSEGGLTVLGDGDDCGYGEVLYACDGFKRGDRVGFVKQYGVNYEVDGEKVVVCGVGRVVIVN